MKRRSFLRNAVASSACASLMTVTHSNAAGANDRVRIGLIGCGGRGRYVAERMRKVSGVEFVAACDVYDAKQRKARALLGSRCETYSDFRRLLDRKDIDAVLVATPDHWHAIPTVLACIAGKDVYVEKPLAHNIQEGRAMLDAARTHKRIVQTGTQQRSAEHFETMRKIIADGRIGNVRYVRIWNFKNTALKRKPKVESETVPHGLDWDFFLGPAPSVPYSSRRYENFRRYWDYAGGIATNYGTHRFDSVRHAMSIDDLAPKTVSAAGHRFEIHDGSEDPDVVQMTFEYDDFIISYEGCMMSAMGVGFRTPGRPYYNMLGTHDRPNGMAFYGTEGVIVADRLGFELYPELKPGRRADRLKPEEVSPDLFRLESQSGRSDESTFLHAKNFIDCVRSRRKPVAEIEIGHGSSILPHLGNIACRTGEKLVWNSENETIVNSEEASLLLGREARKPWDLI